MHGVRVIFRVMPKAIPGVLLLALAALAAPAATAQVAITTLGATEAQACFRDAGDGVTSDTSRCDQALRDPNLVPRDRQATLVNRGIVLNRAGQAAEALAGFDSALAADAALAEAWLNRGNSLYLLGQPEGALADYRRSLALGLRRDHVAWYNIGLVHHARGEIDEATRAWLEALARNPDFTQAAERLALAGPGAGALARLLLAMTGDFDNRRQHATQSTPPGAEPQFGLLHLKRRLVAVPALGAQVVYSQINEGAADGPLYRQNFLVFERDAGGAITSRAWRWRDAGSAAALPGQPGALAGAAAGDFLPALPPGCDMRWQEEGRFIGRIAAADCSVVSGRTGQPRGIRATEIIEPGRLRSEEAGFAPDGTLLFGLPDGVYYEFDPLPAGD